MAFLSLQSARDWPSAHYLLPQETAAEPPQHGGAEDQGAHRRECAPRGQWEDGVFLAHKTADQSGGVHQAAAPLERTAVDAATQCTEWRHIQIRARSQQDFICHI